MATKTNFNVRTQAVAYKEGLQDGLKMLIDTLIEQGDVNFLIDVLEDNAAPADADRLRAYYAAKRH